MSYTHNSEADFAASELARMFVAQPSLCYGVDSLPEGVSASASYEPSSSPWPKADGLVSILETGAVTRDIAIEYKRRQEGIHGLLTAIGQAQAYLHKGYSGAVIVVPGTYPTHESPAAYVKGVLDLMGTSAIGVFSYSDIDTSSPTPFADKLACARSLEVVASASRVSTASSGAKTQWVHMREGSTTRDAFCRFLQIAKRMSTGDEPPQPQIPSDLVKAVARIAPGKDAEQFLSNTADEKFLSRVWRGFWFQWVATKEVLTPWSYDGSTYSLPNAFTKILKDDNTGYSQIFQGRAGALKLYLVEQLNAGALTEDRAWELFADGVTMPGQNKQGIRDRAHSYREDLDSSLSHLNWIDSNGYPTDYGYRYTGLCERFGGANSTAAIEYVGATLLQAGHYAAFLHYVHRLSEVAFSADPLAFCQDVRGVPKFTEESYGEYLKYLEEEMTNELRVMRKVSGRDRPRVRTPFQAELTLLRNYGFVNKKRYRLGVGIPIDWERVMSALEVEL
jgi:hypothetical protein